MTLYGVNTVCVMFSKLWETEKYAILKKKNNSKILWYLRFVQLFVHGNTKCT